LKYTVQESNRQLVATQKAANQVRSWMLFEHINTCRDAQTVAGRSMTTNSHNKHRNRASLGLLFLVLSALHPWATLGGSYRWAQEVVGILGVGLVLLASYFYLLHEAALQTEILRLRRQIGEEDIEDTPKARFRDLLSRLQKGTNSWLRVAGGLLIFITAILMIVQFVELALK
jgi:hypothetical protein